MAFQKGIATRAANNSLVGTRRGVAACAPQLSPNAKMVGGWYRSPGDWGRSGVRLDLPLD